MRLFSLLVCGGVLLAAAAPAAGGDPEEGRRLAGQCRTCHGLDGIAKIPVAPHIGGETAGYITRQLEAFRSGAREHEMMTVVASSLTDDAIADLASWYSSLIPVATAPLRRPGETPPEACVDCHGTDGISLLEEAPNLAGENEIYIVTQLKAFKRGKRSNDVMSGIAAALDDGQMFDAAAWYARVRFETRAAE